LGTPLQVYEATGSERFGELRKSESRLESTRDVAEAADSARNVLAEVAKAEWVVLPSVQLTLLPPGVGGDPDFHLQI